MKTMMRRLAVAMMLCVGAAMLAGCGRRDGPDVSALQRFQVGAVLPLTGAGSAAGAYVRDSLTFAATLPEASEEGKTPPLRVVFADSKSNPRDAISAYRHLLSMNPDIRIVFVQMSSVASALSPIAKEDGVVLISIGSTEEPISSNPYFVVNYLDSDTQARLYLNHFDAALPLTVYFLNDEYGRSVETVIRATATGRKVSSHPFSLDSSARDIVASTLPNSGGVVIVGFGGKMAELARELEIMGFKGDILCSAELLIAPNLDIIRQLKAPVWAIEMTALPSRMGDMFKAQLGREATGADILALNGMLIVAHAYRDPDAKRNLTSPQAILRRLEALALSGAAPGVSQLAGQRLIYSASLVRVNQ